MGISDGRLSKRSRQSDRKNLLEVIFSFIYADTWDESREILEKHPELLSKEADSLFDYLLSTAAQQDDEDSKQMYEAYQGILQRCREVGITEVFVELESSPRLELPEELASILEELSQPPISGDISRRIQLLQRAISLFSQEQYPELWAFLQVELGNNLAQNPLGDQADNIEQIIKHYQQALKVRTRQHFPVHWAGIQNNLANAFSNRILGDRADNIEQAIELYKQALEIRTRQHFPEDWAATQNNLADAYYNRIRGDRADNIELAIEHYQQALEVRTHQEVPEDWAVTQNNLANAFNTRIHGDRADNFEQAIELYKQALEIRTRQHFPVDWAMIQNNLANAFNTRIHGDRADNIEQAIEHYQLALEVRTRQHFPVDWAMTKSNLALALSDRIRGDRADNIERAIQHYQQALEVYTPDSYPNDCRKTARNLGNLYFKEHCWKKAADFLILAKSAAERLYQASVFRSNKEAELAETGALCSDASYVLAKAGLALEAAVSLEQGRARGLSEAMARDKADLQRVMQADLEAYELYEMAASIIRNQESSEWSAGADSDRTARPDDLLAYELYQIAAGVTRNQESLEWSKGADSDRTERQVFLREVAFKAHAEMIEATERIRRIPGYETFLKEPDEGDISAAVIEDLPLVYLVTTAEGSLALIANKGQSREGGAKSQGFLVETVWLDRFNQSNLLELLSGPLEDLGSEGWFGAYNGWLESRKLQDQDAYENAENLWFETIVKVTEKLWDGVMKPVLDRMSARGFTQAILVPSGYLALLPLHAASWVEDGKRHYALEKISLAYAPSARSLVQAMNIAKSTKGETLLAIDEPESAASPLPSSQDEVNSIAAYFKKPKIMRHKKAKREEVLKALPKFQVAHFSCHGSVNWNDPNQSGLLMAHDQMLTVQDLFQLNLKGARMATLSACEIGMVGAKLPDEVVALPSAFIRAGFAGVVSSLWTVEDQSAALLMKEFYRLWQKEGLVPIKALNEAQKQLRENKRFEHPFYWAAFYLTGV